MLPSSLCRLWQPDRAANAAQDNRSYTTAWGTITASMTAALRRTVQRCLALGSFGIGARASARSGPSIPRLVVDGLESSAVAVCMCVTPFHQPERKRGDADEKADRCRQGKKEGDFVGRYAEHRRMMAAGRLKYA